MNLRGFFCSFFRVFSRFLAIWDLKMPIKKQFFCIFSSGFLLFYSFGVEASVNTRRLLNATSMKQIVTSRVVEQHVKLSGVRGDLQDQVVKVNSAIVIDQSGLVNESNIPTVFMMRAAGPEIIIQGQ